jgi:hypothetical protein
MMGPACLVLAQAVPRWTLCLLPCLPLALAFSVWGACLHGLVCSLPIAAVQHLQAAAYGTVISVAVCQPQAYVPRTFANIAADDICMRHLS